MLSNYCVDIWFCYGSFFYGFESKIYSYGEEELDLILNITNKEEANELDLFIEQLIEKPKGLLRVDLKIYGPEKVFKKYKMGTPPVYLFTDLVPKQLPKMGSLPFLKFVGVKGISPNHSEFFNTLIHQIWCQN